MTNKVYTIEDWSLVSKDEWDGYTAPELMKIYVGGSCQERATELGLSSDIIRTTHVVNFNKTEKVLTTKSGSKYKLGKPNTDYVKWCTENGHDPYPLVK